MNAHDFDAAAAFIAANARIIDRRRFQRLFGDGSPRVELDLTGSTSLASGIAVLSYRPRPAAAS